MSDTCSQTAAGKTPPAAAIPLGKRRRLQQAASGRGTFTILALDHRGPLRRALAKQVRAEEVEAALVALKCDIVEHLAPYATAVLLDPETALAPCLECGVLPGQTGMLLALDTGSTGDPAVLKTDLIPGWSAARAAAVGAAGVKLLVYYHPDSPEAAGVEGRVKGIAEDATQAEIPFYLEPLAFSPRQPGQPLPSGEHRGVVLEAAARLVPLGVDVLKAEFPVNVTEEADEGLWRAACQELSQACSVPWVLLSAGAPFETFLRQTVNACLCGASGVMAGRAIWQEAVTVDVTARRQFLQTVGRERMQRLRAVCEGLARPAFRSQTLSTLRVLAPSRDEGK